MGNLPRFSDDRFGQLAENPVNASLGESALISVVDYVDYAEFVAQVFGDNPPQSLIDLFAGADPRDS
jgi:hypothetical protein